MIELPLSRRAPAYFEPSVDSTNLVLRRMAATAADGTAVAASAGDARKIVEGIRGIFGPGGLYLSMLLRPHVEAERLPTLTPVAAVAVCRAIERVCGVSGAIKWPNDVVLGGKKICGILVESVLGDALPCVIVGIGVNANTREFPDELRAIAGSIRDVTGTDCDLTALAAALIEELDACYAAWLAGADDALEEYRRRCLTVGREVLVGDRRGFARTIGGDYSLLVDYPDGSSQSVRFGEVSVRGLYGYV